MSPGVTQHVVGGAPLAEQTVEGALLTPTTPDQQQSKYFYLCLNNGHFGFVVSFYLYLCYYKCLIVVFIKRVVVALSWSTRVIQFKVVCYNNGIMFQSLFSGRQSKRTGYFIERGETNRVFNFQLEKG